MKKTLFTILTSALVASSAFAQVTASIPNIGDPKPLRQIPGNTLMYTADGNDETFLAKTNTTITINGQTQKLADNPSFSLLIPVNADWKETDTNSLAFIRNKPKSVEESGISNAVKTADFQVLLGEVGELQQLHNKDMTDVSNRFTSVEGSISTLSENLTTASNTLYTVITNTEEKLETSISTTASELLETIVESTNELHTTISGEIDAKISDTSNILSQATAAVSTDLHNNYYLKTDVEDLHQSMSEAIHADIAETNAALYQTISSEIDSLNLQIYSDISTTNAALYEIVTSDINTLNTQIHSDIATTNNALHETITSEITNILSTNVWQDDLGHGIYTITINGNPFVNIDVNDKNNSINNIFIPVVLNDLSDVTLPESTEEIVDGQVLMYDTNSATWKNGTIVIPEQIHANWTENNQHAVTFIENKPHINTTNENSQRILTNALITGTIQLHKIASTGSFADLVDKPTTLDGYGITDAVKLSVYNSAISNLTNATNNLNTRLIDVETNHLPAAHIVDAEQGIDRYEISDKVDFTNDSVPTYKGTDLATTTDVNTAYSNATNNAYSTMTDYVEGATNTVYQSATNTAHSDAEAIVLAATNQLDDVAYTGSYNDLSDTPDIRNPKLEIKRNNSLIATYYGNGTDDVTANITVPVNINGLNDVTTSSPESGQILTYRNNKWINETPEKINVSDEKITITTNDVEAGSFTLNQNNTGFIDIHVPTNNLELVNGAEYVTDPEVRRIEHTINEKETLVILTSDINELIFKRGDTENTTNSIVLPEATEEKTGKIMVYVEEVPSKEFHYDFADDNLDVFTDLEDDEKPWLTNENDAMWLFTFTSVPGETTWHCDTFKEYTYSVSPGPQARGETTFIVDGTEQTYDIVGTLDQQWMINHGLFDGDSWDWLVTITSADIGTNVTRIGNYAFSGCSGLMSVTIPDSVTSIESHAFYNCTGLTSITIPDSVMNIGEYAFSSCDSMTSVMIGNSVTSIGEQAFYRCMGLTSVTIPESVTNIESRAFYSCIGLTSMTIPNSVTSIGSSAFYNCYSMTSVMIGNGMTSIGENAFALCSDLTSVTMSGKTTTQVSGMSNHYWSLPSRCKIYCEGGEYITVP